MKYSELASVLESSSAPSPPDPPPGAGDYHVNISVEGLAVLSTALIAVAVKFLKPWAYRTWAQLTRRDMIDAVLVRDSLVAAMAISRSKSIHLTRFHNGTLDESGFHMVRMSLVEKVSVPPYTTEWDRIGKRSVLLRDLPEDDLSVFLKDSFKDVWIEFDYESDMFNDKCKRFVAGLGHKFQIRRIIFAGNVAAGALCINFSTKEEGMEVVKNLGVMANLESIFINLSEIILSKLSSKDKENLSTSVFRFITEGGKKT